MKPPVVIGAMGGSGTRVVARIIQRAGIFIGTNRNESEDAMEFVEFFDRWINRFIRRERIPLTEAEATAMDIEFRDCVGRHRATIPAGQLDWGWKEPRSIYLLPFFHKRFPDMKFIHVLRDGRDMAFSSNQNQLRKHGEAVLEGRYDVLPTPVRAAALWNKINSATADYGEAAMGGRYIRIRFEDLCRQPAVVIRTIYTFLGGSAAAAPVVADVNPPESLGRWRTAADPELAAAIHQHAQPALRRFGYCP